MKDRIIVFGNGRYYQQKEKCIKEKYEIIAFIDNAISVNDAKKYEQINVYNPAKLHELPTENILICSVNRWKMYEQLIKMGIKFDRILFATQIVPFYDNEERMLANDNIRLISNYQGIQFVSDSNEIICKTETEYYAYMRCIYEKKDKWIKVLRNIPVEPISRRFGLERGTPIDRYYIGKIISDNSEFIKGNVMEIADLRYTSKYGSNVKNAYILHVNGWGNNVIKGDLVSGEGIVEDSIDCLICTQTIQFIYDLNSVVKNIYKLLSPNGTAIITASGIAGLSMYDYRNWGEYWKFTSKSLKQLFEQSFEPDKIQVVSYGNMKTAIGFLYGLTVEDLDDNDFNYDDEQYAVTYGVVVRK